MTSATETASWAAAIITFAVYFGRFIKEMTEPTRELVVSLTGFLRARNTQMAEDSEEFRREWRTALALIEERLLLLEERGDNNHDQNS